MGTNLSLAMLRLSARAMLRHAPKTAPHRALGFPTKQVSAQELKERTQAALATLLGTGKTEAPSKVYSKEKLKTLPMEELRELRVELGDVVERIDEVITAREKDPASWD